MAFNFSRRTAQIGVWKNLYTKKGEDYVSGLDLPIIFTLKEKDLEVIVPTPQASEGEAQFFSLLEFFFDAEGKFLYPYLSPLKIHRTPDDLDVTIWDADSDDRRKLVLNNVRAKKVEYSAQSGAGVYGSLAMVLEIRGLSPGDHVRFIEMQKRSRDLSIKATQDDLFERKEDAPNPPEEGGEEQQTLDAAAPPQGAEDPPAEKPKSKKKKKAKK
jgi:hypothetical protein